MKKIISMICTVAIMISMITVANANATNTLSWKIVPDSQTEDSVQLALYLNTDKQLNQLYSYWDFSAVTSIGGTVSVVPNGDALSQFVSAQNMVTANLSTAAGFTGEVLITTVTINNINEEFTIKLMASTSRTKTYLKVGTTDVTTDFTISPITVEPLKVGFSAETTDKGLYKEDDVQAGIFYNLAIKNNAGDVDIAVDGKKFTTEGLVATTGDAVLELTVVIVGYPYATVPACTVTEVAAQ